MSRPTHPVSACFASLSSLAAICDRLGSGRRSVILASVPQVALETVQPMLLMVLIDAIVGHDVPGVRWAVLGLIGLIPIYVAGNFVGEYIAARVGAKVCNDLRIAGFWRLQSLSVSYLRSQTAATCCRGSVPIWMRSSAPWRPSFRSPGRVS